VGISGICKRALIVGSDVSAATDRLSYMLVLPWAENPNTDISQLYDGIIRVYFHLNFVSNQFHKAVRGVALARDIHKSCTVSLVLSFNHIIPM
jgi:hypothetical protein